MKGQRSKHFRTALALAGASLVGVLLLVSWLLVQKGLVGREAGEQPRMGAVLPWDESFRSPEVTTNGVTLAGRYISFGGDKSIQVEFWLLVRDPALQDFPVRPVEVSLYTKEKEYTLRGTGALLAGGGIHFAGADFSGYDYATSHPNVPGGNKELALSIKALDVLDPAGNVTQVIEGPWETVVAVKNDLSGGAGTGYSFPIGEKLSQSQFGVTVRLRPGAGVGFIQTYEVVQEGKPTRFLPLGAGPRIISQEEYEAAQNRAAEVLAKGPYYDWPTVASPTPETPSGPMSMGSQTGNAIVEVGSASIPQGQQAQVPVTVKGVNDPDGLGAYTFKITFNPAVINVVSVSGGQAPFNGTPTQNINNTAGQVLLTNSHGNIPGPTGDIVVAYITLQAVGSPGSSTVLDISITTLSETANGDTIPAVDQDGTVTIVP